MNEIDERRNYYEHTFSSGAMASGKLEEKLELMSLICLVTFKMKKTKPEMDSRKVIEAITNIDLSVPQLGYHDFLIGLAIKCDDLLYEIKEIDTYGYKTSDEIINRIKTLLDGWFPF